MAAALRHGADGERGAIAGPFWRDRLAGDPQLRAELRFCNRVGLAHSAFLAWPDDDQDKALAFDLVDAGICDGCGQPLTETTDKANENAYVARAMACAGCEAKLWKAKTKRDEPLAAAIRYRVERRVDA